MHIALNTGWYYPESWGGTEVYVSQLAKHLIEKEMQVTVISPIKTPMHSQNGEQVHNYDGKAMFQELVGRADIYHQHSITENCDWQHLMLAKGLGKPVVFTAHMPPVLCKRGTMMLYGKTSCDGEIRTGRCSSCWAHDLGMPSRLAQVLYRFPLMPSFPLPGKVGTALGLREQVRQYRRDVMSGCEAVDRLVVVCEWLRQAMKANGVPSGKLLLSRQGIGAPVLGRNAARRPGPLRFGYVGRWDRVKGLDLLTEVIKFCPQSLRFEMHLCGSPASGDSYADRIKQSVLQDGRVHVHNYRTPEQMEELWEKIDILLAPSQWLETGPLVVQEALARGIPVAGSNLGSIAEWVIDGKNGWLLPHDRPRAWVNLLERLVLGEECLPTFSPNTRTMADVSGEMLELYEDLLRS